MENSLDWLAKGYQTKGGRGPWAAICQRKKSCSPYETKLEISFQRRSVVGSSFKKKILF